jgi:hypothetical protein
VAACGGTAAPGPPAPPAVNRSPAAHLSSIVVGRISPPAPDQHYRNQVKHGGDGADRLTFQQLVAFRHVHLDDHQQSTRTRMAHCTRSASKAATNDRAASTDTALEDLLHDSDLHVRVNAAVTILNITGRAVGLALRSGRATQNLDRRQGRPLAARRLTSAAT